MILKFLLMAFGFMCPIIFAVVLMAGQTTNDTYIDEIDGHYEPHPPPHEGDVVEMFFAD